MLFRASCLPSPSWQAAQQDLSRRVDLRHLEVCSIDPPGVCGGGGMDGPARTAGLQACSATLWPACMGHCALPGCTDIDDALHLRELPNGNYEAGVHIADVSHFIRPGTAMDLEAAKRGTTVYLSNRRIDMVPELLSSNLCSLRGGEERFAFSCIWELTPEASRRNPQFSRLCSSFRRVWTTTRGRIGQRVRVCAGRQAASF